MKCLYMRTEMDILSKVYYIIIVWRENFSKLADNHQILQYFSCLVLSESNVRIEYLVSSRDHQLTELLLVNIKLA